MNTNPITAATSVDVDVDVAAATVIGRNHRRADRPCQDAHAVRRSRAATVVAVCDGCGSGGHSELGARLGAHLFTAALLVRLDGGAAVDDPRVWRAACDEVLDRLAELVPVLAPDRDAGAAIAEHLLFTLLAAAVTPDGAAILAVGDGIVIVDGDVRVLEAADDAPAYLGYELVGPPQPVVVTAAPAARAIVLATDGARPLLDHAGAPLPAGRGTVLDLVAACADDRLFRNPDALRRRLAVASQEVVDVDWTAGRLVRTGGLLTDDTTVVAIRRRRC
jgi:hypothetical protein